MKRKFFITGTDTNIGKTYVSIQLLNAFAKLGFSTIGLKPIAAGAKYIDSQWINEDAQRLQQASTTLYDYQIINPVCFPEFIAPHIAAKNNHKKIIIDDIVAHINSVSAKNIDVMICEGVGGWDVPLDDNQYTMAHLVKRLNFSVILVVGMRLGCLNHAILTCKAMQTSGAYIAGWIANCIDPAMPYLADNIKTLQHWLNIPLLATIPYNEKANFTDLIDWSHDATSHLDRTTFR